eukprot:6019171-Ditylum_brightwellii.AAC.1
MQSTLAFLHNDLRKAEIALTVAIAARGLIYSSEAELNSNSNVILGYVELPMHQMEIWISKNWCSVL